MKKRAKTRTSRGNHSLLPLSWNSFNHALTTLEKQAHWAYNQFKHSLPRQWERKLNQLTHEDIIRLAMKKRKQITKEVKYFADGIVDTINRADILPNKNRLVKQAKRNLANCLHMIQKSDVAKRARDLAMNKGSELVSMLNFPSKKQVAKLNARLSQLEKRLKGLTRPAAR